MIIIKNFKNQKGAVLIFGVLIVSIVLTASLGISILILSEIKQTKNVNDSIIAYYTAECGAENGLYEFRKKGEDINNINDSENINQGTWVRTASDKEDQIFVTFIENNDFIYINLYDPDAVHIPSGVLDYHADIESFTIECQDDGTGSGVIVTAEKWNSDISDLVNYTGGGFGVPYACQGIGAPQPYPSILGHQAYRIKIQADTADVHNLIFKPYSDNPLVPGGLPGAPMQMFGKKTIKSLGTHNNAKSGVQAEMPAEPPW